MQREPNKRPRRIPRTSEEVNEFIAYRKRKERLALASFKKTTIFKILNICNVLCIFVFVQIVFCYLGPCHYQTHYTYHVNSRIGREFKPNGQANISELDLYALDGNMYTVVINDFIKVPDKFTSFKIGKDFIMQKKLKVVLNHDNQAFRLFLASPVIFLSFFLSFVSFMAYHFNLNENLFSLWGLVSLNILTLSAILVY